MGMETIAGWKANDEVHNYALWGAAGNRRVGLRGVEFESHVAVHPRSGSRGLRTVRKPLLVSRYVFATLFLDSHPVIMRAFQSYQSVSPSLT